MFMPNRSPRPSASGPLHASLHRPVAVDLGVVGRAAHVLEDFVRCRGDVGGDGKGVGHVLVLVALASPTRRRTCHSGGLMVKALVHPEWVRRLNLFGDVVGDPQHIVGLDPDELLAVARASTGLTDTGEAEWPGWEDTYRRLLTSIDTEVAAAPARPRAHAGRGAAHPPDVAAAAGHVDARTRRSAPSRSTRRCSSSVRRVRARRSCSSCSRSTRSLRTPLAWEALAPLPVGTGDAATDRAPAARARGVRAGVLGRHPSRVHDDARARERPAVRVRALPRRYDFAGSVLVDALRHAELHRLAARAPRDAGRVYRLHRRMLQTFQHGDADAAAALAAEVAGAPVDAAAGVRGVPRRTRDPHAPRPAQVHRVAREPARASCASRAATASTSPRSGR